jgi:hypothetical protein
VHIWSRTVFLNEKIVRSSLTYLLEFCTSVASSARGQPQFYAKANSPCRSADMGFRAPGRNARFCSDACRQWSYRGCRVRYRVTIGTNQGRPNIFGRSLAAFRPKNTSAALRDFRGHRVIKEIAK